VLDIFVLIYCVRSFSVIVWLSYLLLYYILVECLLDWNIDTKLSIITLDNYSTNDCMIEKIKGKLQLGTLIKEEVFLHIRCCAHILNLIVKDGLGVVKDGVEKI